MKLYLVQHGEAKSKEEDPKRPLTEKGKKDAQKIASFLKNAGIKPASIFHSGKERARETAEIIGNAIGIDPVQKDSLSPLDDPKVWAERIKNMDEDIMIVGHLPHLSRLSSLLLVGDPEKNIIAFRMAGIVCLRREEENWSVSWMIIPDLL